MKKITVGILLAALVFSFAHAETTEDIIKKINAQYKGADKNIKTMEMEQTITVVQEKENFVTTSKMQRKNDKFRMEMTIPLEEGQEGMTTTILFDGKDMWTLLPMVGKQKLSGKDAEKYENEKEGHWWEDADKMEYVGDEKVNGEDCYILVKKEDKSEVTRMWLSKTGLYPVKSETNVDKDKLITIYSDVKTVDGYKMPYKYSIYEKEKLISEVQIKSMKINIDLSDDLFDAEKLKSDVNVQDMFKGLMPKF